MESKKRLKLPLSEEEIKSLICGEQVLLNGEIFTARDAAHKRMFETLKSGKSLPFDIKGGTVYYAGPAPARPGQIIGSCGPTTSGRMDAYSPYLIKQGLKVMIGKGERSCEVIEAIKNYGGIYFGATGGAGALISKSIKSAEVIAYDDLGTEAIRLLIAEDFPVTVVIDSSGNCLYDMR